MFKPPAEWRNIKDLFTYNIPILSKQTWMKPLPVLLPFQFQLLFFPDSLYSNKIPRVKESTELYDTAVCMHEFKEDRHVEAENKHAASDKT
jgi:hypothetical protein